MSPDFAKCEGQTADGKGVFRKRKLCLRYTIDVTDSYYQGYLVFPGCEGRDCDWYVPNNEAMGLLEEEAD